ncbi:MAG TPA: sigma-70 family RNA polymerase sigma factor [Planctomycetota bacterium]|nr:sigma-70 family RNA polymerase sigma factor [Planctomycetota bacterium]
MNPLTQTIDLVKQAQSGSRPALDRLLTRYYERVRRVVRVRIGAKLRRHLETADLLQQTLLTAVRKFDQFEMRYEGSLIDWLAKIAEHQIRDQVDHFGAQKRQRIEQSIDEKLTADASADLAGRLADQKLASPSTANLEREELEALEQCLDLLPPGYRELIVLRDYEDLPWEEVARISGRPTESAARNMHAKAKLELVRMLRQRGHGLAEA